MTWVHDRIFAAGGSHIPATWAAFHDQTMIEAVVHLRPYTPAPFEGGAPAAFLWLDIGDESQADTQCRRLAGSFVQAQVDRGRSVLIHSPLGRHRTRWVYVAFLLCQQVAVTSALQAAEERPWLAPYHTDEAAWSELAESLASSPATLTPDG
jgi:hypothetical protein